MKKIHNMLPNIMSRCIASLAQPQGLSAVYRTQNPQQAMHAKLYAASFLLLLLLLGVPAAMAQTPQPANCGTCDCPGPMVGSGTLFLNEPTCPGTETWPIGTNRRWIRFNALPGYEYRVSLCGNTTTEDTKMWITSQANPGVPIPTFCDDDGCGVSGGFSALTFVAPIVGPPTGTPYKIFVTLGDCNVANPNFSSVLNIAVTCNGLPTPPPNDEPCGAIDLGPLSGSCSSPVAGTTVAATQTSLNGLNSPPLSVAHGCGSVVNYTGAGGDVWFSVEVPPTGLVGIETTETSLCAGGMGFYRSPDCTAGPYEWVTGLTGTEQGLCSTDGLFGPYGSPGIVFDAFAYGMAAGDVVYIRYWERSGNEAGEFTICAYAPQRPVNDQPCGAIDIVAADPCTPVLYSTENSSASHPGVTIPNLLPSCGNPGAGLPINDLWFRVTVPATNHFTVSTFAGTLDDMAMAWYRLGSGDLCTPPATLTQIACNRMASGTDLMPRINSNLTNIVPPLVAGEQIYIRVWSDKPSESNYWGTFSLCVTPNEPPANNLPCGAEPLEVNFDCIQTPGTTENATTTPASFPPTGSTMGASSCAGVVLRDVWYTVQVPLDLGPPFGLEFNTEAYSTNLNTGMTIYRPTGDCSSTLALTQLSPGASCSQTGGIATPPPSSLMPRILLNVPTIVPGELLYIRMTGRLTSQGNFGICVRRTDPQKCAGIVYDSGGPTGNYSNNEVFQETYCPTKPGDVVTLTFLEFETEANYDFLRIYNGTSTAAPLIGVWSGGNSPGVITATVNAANPQGCLTVRFTTDFSVVRPGFAFKLSCASYIPQPPAVGDCGLQVFDPGGPGGNYANGIGSYGNPAYQQTYCANVPGEVVTLTFNSFNIENNWDKLWIFDGPTTASPIISSGNGMGFGPNNLGVGAYWGNGNIGPFTATITASNPDGCITIYFQTDASVTYSGWQASVSCAEPGAVGPGGGTPVIGGGPGQVTTACGSFFLDDGNTGEYANSANYTRTICPAVAGELVQISFLSFNVEQSGPTSCWDALYVYDGPTTASPLINSGKTSTNWPPLPNPHGPGGYCGEDLPGPFTSSHPSGCLTFRFFSDNIITRPGWRARVDCFVRPTNDEPCPAVSAIALPVSVACVPVEGTNLGATPSAGMPPTGCGNYQGGDVWYRFTAPPNGRVFIESYPGTLTDGAMALYSAASCPGPFSLVQCNDDGAAGTMPRIDRLCNPLVPGQQYWLRFWGNSGEQGTYSICVRTRDDAQAISDCLGAFTLCSDEPFSGSNLGTGCSNDLSAANWGCLTGGERQGNWYAFSVQNPGTLGMTITPSGMMDLDWGIWGPYTPGTLPNSVAGTCTPTIPPIRCSNASLYYTLQATPGSAATGMGNANPTLNNPRYGIPLLLPVGNRNDGPGLPTDGWLPGINVSAGQVYLLFVDDHHLNGGTYTVDWLATPTGIEPDVMNCAILPVELLSFDARARGEHVDVLWSTATERNSSHFIVQRSADSEHFLDIGRVAAAGESMSNIDYGFVDQEPLQGISYYRLKQVDIDGAIKYSEMVPVAFGPGQRGLELYPNPAVERVWVLFDVPAEGQVHWVITDASGRRADDGNYSSSRGRNGLDIELSKLETGTYLLQLYDAQNGPIGQARFVKQH